MSFQDRTQHQIGQIDKEVCNANILILVVASMHQKFRCITVVRPFCGYNIY